MNRRRFLRGLIAGAVFISLPAIDAEAAHVRRVRVICFRKHRFGNSPTAMVHRFGDPNRGRIHRFGDPQTARLGQRIRRHRFTDRPVIRTHRFGDPRTSRRHRFGSRCINGVNAEA